MALAPLDFPPSPPIGTIYPNPAVAGQPQYTYDGEKWSGGAGVGNVYMSDFPPAAPAGSLWFETDTGILYVRYNDGDSLQWLAIPGGPADAVRYGAQTLTPVQQDQARRNIDVRGGDLAGVWAYKTATNGITIFADYAALFNVTSSNVYGVAGLANSLDVTASGANGLDTGTITTGGYHYFVIYNPTSGQVALLVSLSATAPVMPSGYTYKRRLGWFYYSGGVTNFSQRNRRFAYAAPRPIASSTSAWTAFSLTNFVPLTVTNIRGRLISNNNTVQVGDNLGGLVVSSNGIPAQAYWFWEFMLHQGAFSVYYSSSSAGGMIEITGWEDNL